MNIVVKIYLWIRHLKQNIQVVALLIITRREGNLFLIFTLKNWQKNCKGKVCTMRCNSERVAKLSRFNMRPKHKRRRISWLGRRCGRCRWGLISGTRRRCSSDILWFLWEIFDKYGVCMYHLKSSSYSSGRGALSASTHSLAKDWIWAASISMVGGTRARASTR